MHKNFLMRNVILLPYVLIRIFNKNVLIFQIKKVAMIKIIIIKIRKNVFKILLINNHIMIVLYKDKNFYIISQPSRYLINQICLFLSHN